MDATIPTDRLVLRYVTAHDAAVIERYVRDPRVYENVAGIPMHQPRSATITWIATHADRRRANTAHTYAIELRNALIGVISLQRPTQEGLFGLGYWLAPQSWGHGYTTEAAQALLHTLETRAGAQATTSGYFADNPASGRVLQKLGYVETGREELYSAGRTKLVPHIVVKRPATR